MLDLNCLESELKSKVRELAIRLGWEYYHTNDSRRSEAGFPDLVLVKNKRLIFAELKRQNKDPTTEQKKWLFKLIISDSCEVYVWKPSDWNNDTILNVLK